jgi:Fur family transcriptional regulator, zinc uptake regulator
MPRPVAISQNDHDVLRVLTSAARPLSAYDILAEMKAGGVKAPNQVYRSLVKLGRRGLVHRIEALNAFVACKGDHRHEPAFVICRDCGLVREFEDERLAAIASEVSEQGFRIETVSLEIYGLCGTCGPSAKEAA